MAAAPPPRRGRGGAVGAKWGCSQCTYLNPGRMRACDMCGHVKAAAAAAPPAAEDRGPSGAGTDGGDGGAPPQPPMEAGTAMEGDKFAKLNELLNKTQMYSEFIAQGLSAPAGGATAAAPRGAAPRGPTMPVPRMLRGELKSYQRIGVEWLVSLYQNGVFGILADEMGLGKTIQTIGYFAYLLENSVGGPHLIVVPLSVLPNWTREFAKWLPDARVTEYYGPKGEREGLRDRIGVMGQERLQDVQGSKRKRAFFDDGAGRHAGGWGVYLTTFDIAIADHKWLAQHRWQTVVVDEAHRLKNFQCRLMQRLRGLEADHRVLLTGTPLQNNLRELWSILNYCMPQLFDDLDAFTQWFDLDDIHHPGDGSAAACGEEERGSQQDAAEGGGGEAARSEQQRTVVTKLHAILRPFMLRRRKAQVASELPLPAKREVALFVHLPAAQRTQYNAIVERRLPHVSGGSESTLANVVMQLQKLCNHPMLFRELDPFAGRGSGVGAIDDVWETGDDGECEFVGRSGGTAGRRERRRQYIIESSGKMQLLDKMLARLQRGGHRVLIFSQMTSMLDLIEEYLRWKGYFGGRRGSYRIDGNVASADRQRMIEEFGANADAFVFLLSTRAGGLGINLTSADTVVIYDSDWNPQNDLQAQARCHRIGQQREVVVYRLVTKGTIERYLLDRAARKLGLEDLVIERGRFDSRQSHRLDAAELRDALRGAGADASFGDALGDDQLLDRLLDRRRVLALLAERRGAAAGATPAKGKRPRAAVDPLSPEAGATQDRFEVL